MLFCTVISVYIETAKCHCTKMIENNGQFSQLITFIIEPFIFITNEFSAQLYHLKTFKTNPLGLRNILQIVVGCLLKFISCLYPCHLWTSFSSFSL